MGNQIVIPSMGNWYEDYIKSLNLKCINILDSGTFFSTLECVNVTNGKHLIVRAYQYDQSLEDNVVANTSQIYFQNILNNIGEFPGIVPFSSFFVQGTVAILVRDKFEYTLPQRLEEYPPLKQIEKLWVIYQIIQITLSLHRFEMVHGCITPNNIFLTWDLKVFIGDLAPFKPSQIRWTRPDLIHHFYRLCYLAPEQLISPEQFDIVRFTHPTYNMDLFSIGCIIYYLYTGNQPFLPFELKQYSEGTFHLNFNQIPENLRPLCQSLLSIEPQKRSENLQYYIQTAFPSNFHRIFSQFQELHSSQSGLSNLIGLVQPFEFIVLVVNQKVD